MIPAKPQERDTEVAVRGSYVRVAFQRQAYLDLRDGKLAALKCDNAEQIIRAVMLGGPCEHLATAIFRPDEVAMPVVFGRFAEQSSQ